MNGRRGLSDTVAVPVDKRKLPVEVAIRDFSAKSVAYVVRTTQPSLISAECAALVGSSCASIPVS
jgi:hypothetical protein